MSLKSNLLTWLPMGGIKSAMDIGRKFSNMAIVSGASTSGAQEPICVKNDVALRVAATKVVAKTTPETTFNTARKTV